MDDQSQETGRAKTHGDLRKMYEHGGDLGDWGKLDPLTQQDALITAQTLKKSGVIPIPRKKGEKIVVLSPSSNIGFYEAMIRATFGNNYVVVAGDIANIERLGFGQAAHIQFDAKVLPFPDDSLNVVFDRQGALWHAAYTDLQAGSIHTQELFKEFHAKLRYGGLLITDQQVIAKLPTGPLIDRVLKNKPPEGYMRPFMIGERNWQYRVYKRL